MNTRFKRTRHRKPGPKLIPYSQLRDNYVFRRLEKGKGLRVFTKVNDAYSINARNGKDAIFLPHELVEPLFPSTQEVV
jgi:hypothetical protein